MHRDSCILLVDEEEDIRVMLTQVLTEEGFTVWSAGTAAEAVEVYRKYYATIDLVLLDLELPGPDGLQLLDALKELNPAIHCCIMSGSIPRISPEQLTTAGALAVFAKPFVLAELVGQLRAILAQDRPGPIQYGYEPASQLLRCELGGRVSTGEILASLRRIIKEPWFAECRRALMDCRQLVPYASMNDVWHFVRFFSEHRQAVAGKRVAVLVARDITYGMARVFESHAEALLGLMVRTCRAEADALAWLQESTSERRRAVRHDCALSMTWGPDRTAQVHNISTGGIGFVHQGERFSEGALLTIRLHGRATRLAPLQLRVAHGSPGPDGAWLLGGAFVAPLAEDELLSLLS